jgi:hypothetical protein
MTRASLALLGGDLASAWTFHPLSFVLWPAAALAVWSALARRHPAAMPAALRAQLARAGQHRSKWMWSAIGLIVGTWIVRLSSGLGGSAL